LGKSDTTRWFYILKTVLNIKPIAQRETKLTKERLYSNVTWKAKQCLQGKHVKLKWKIDGK